MTKPGRGKRVRRAREIEKRGIEIDSSLPSFFLSSMDA
jgi:hypothetical protein